MNENNYQICNNCIMDTSDSNIVFDENGQCEYCTNYYKNILPNWHPNDYGLKLISPLINKIKRDGKNKDYDCLIGLSGGVDSSYVAHIAKELFGLRPMLFHVDAGWNSQEAINNIEQLVHKLNLDLYTEVVNWEEMKSLQRSFFKAQVPHIDTPQDHAFFAGLYNYASKHKYKYILTGCKLFNWCVHDLLNGTYHALDLKHLKDVHKKFGDTELKTFPLSSYLDIKFFRYFKGIRVVKPLNFIPYKKKDAVDLLKAKYGWQAYPHKHYESRFTKFYESYWLPRNLDIKNIELTIQV